MSSRCKHIFHFGIVVMMGGGKKAYPKSFKKASPKSSPKGKEWRYDEKITHRFIRTVGLLYLINNKMLGKIAMSSVKLP